MRQRPLQAVLLVHAIEQCDLDGDVLSMEDRAQATREALESRPLPATEAVPQIDANSQRFLAVRADALLARLRVRSPGVDRVLATAGRSTGLDRAILLLGFALGVAISFAGGRRIDIFAYPLVALVLWNLVVYIMLIVRFFTSAREPASAATASRPAPVREPMARRDGFIRRWLAKLHANRVRARIDALIAQSIGFNAPLAPGLRRFALDWWEVGQPLFRVRAQRLLHLAAILAALGLMAGYAIRGGPLHQAAGWGSTFFGPTSAHAALVTLYGAASGLSGISVPSAHEIQALAWTSPTAGGSPGGEWIELIALTALLYVVIPRLIAVIVTTLDLWRRALTMRVPPTFSGYLAAVLRPTTPHSAPPPTDSLPAGIPPPPRAPPAPESVPAPESAPPPDSPSPPDDSIS
jgi:Protein of unknown function (DUF2868)